MAKCPGQVPSLYSILVWYKIVWHKICVCSCVSVSGCVLLQFDVLLCWAVHLIVAALGWSQTHVKCVQWGLGMVRSLWSGNLAYYVSFCSFCFLCRWPKNKENITNQFIEIGEDGFLCRVLYYLDLSISSSYCNNGCVMQVGM